MHHTMYSPHLRIQIATGQPVPLLQIPVLPINCYTFHQSNYARYVSDATGHDKHQQQAKSSPLELLQLMGVEVHSPKRLTYMQNHPVSENWVENSNPVDNVQTMPPPYYNHKQTNSLKKQNLNYKVGKRNSYYDRQVPQNEVYSSDSGISSRSSTPNKYKTDSSQTESSDERDSIVSLTEPSVKRLQEVHPNSHTMTSFPVQEGMALNTPTHRFYQNHPPGNYYHNFIATPQNYQNKRRYPLDKSGPLFPKPRGRKYPGMSSTNGNVIPKYTTAPDRFLAKSYSVHVTQTPKDLLDGSIWDRLSKDIWDKFMSHQQTEATYKNKMMLWKFLYTHIKIMFPKYGLFLVGSTLNGFGSNNSDVDMCLLVRHTEMDQKNEAIFHLEQVSRCLRKCECIKQLELIQAKVPILKFHDSNRNLEIDLNCNNPVGIRNTHLLYCYSRIDWRVRPLVVIVKLWAQSQDINDAKNMTISSYSLVLMVIHFLQCGVSPPVLPCLHSLFPNKFGPHTDIHMIDINEDLHVPSSLLGPANRQTLGELLLQFFKYYVEFDFIRYAISVRTASKVPVEECQRARSFKNDFHQWKYLCIEEPFDLTNTARSVYDGGAFYKITNTFNHTYKQLRDSHDLGKIFQTLTKSSKT